MTVLAAWSAMVALTAPGCAGTTRPIGDDAGAIHVGVHYSAQVARRCSPQRNFDLVKRDFANIKKMKIDAVLIDDLQPDDVDSVLQIAAEDELKLILADPEAVNRVRGLSQSPNTITRLPESKVIGGYYLGHVVDSATFARARQEAARVQSVHPGAATFVHMDASMISDERARAFDHVIAYSPWGTDSHKQSASNGGFQTLRFGGENGDSDATIRSWLLSFHRGLARGQSEGLLIEGFRTLPGEKVGLVHQDAPLSPERITMVQRIATRAKLWRKVLTGLSPTPLVPLEESLANVEVTLLARGTRRCILVINPSTTDFARGEVVLPVELNGSPVVRAVVVPADGAAGLGEVIRARQSRLVIPVVLAPGDAALFDLF